MKDKCPLCGTEAEILSEKSDSILFECPTCGRFLCNTALSTSQDFTIKDKTASYLYYHSKLSAIENPDDYFYGFIGNQNVYDEFYKDNSRCFHVTDEIVENWYPKTFNEKVDMFLLGLARKTKFLGEELIFTEEQLLSACFAVRHPDGPMKNMPTNDIQLRYFRNCLREKEYIKGNACTIKILQKGWERIDELQKNQAENTKNVFVAMSFDKDMNKIRDAIKAAIIKCGFIPCIMDEKEHNHQIVPEMLYEIRRSRFLIAELTKHNNGAYFEAGYALGFGKETIHLCKKESFDEDGHFDVKQVNTILWEDEEDLKQRLIKRIKATIV